MKLIIDTASAAGINGHTLEFIINFLQNRKFIVSSNNEMSRERVLESGIPQGSVLSVTLFLITINTITSYLSPHIEFF